VDVHRVSRGVAHGRHDRLDVGQLGRIHGEKFGSADDGRNRCAEFVADGGEELVLACSREVTAPEGVGQGVAGPRFNHA